MSLSSLPFLFALEVTLLAAFGARALRRHQIDAGFFTGLLGIVVILTGWGGMTAWLAWRGVYQSEAFLAAWPAFWITMVPPIVCMAPWLVSRGVRVQFRALIDDTPAHWLTGFQALRMAAIGGVVKGYGGTFSGYYALFIGVPDFLYGVSAFALTLWGAKRAAPEKLLLVWHLLGAVIIVPFGVVLLQIGLPGPAQVFGGEPDITSIFAFPMALAPTLVVPIFVVVNLMVAMRLIERLSASRCA